MRCVDAPTQVRAHVGYPPSGKDHADMRLLRDRLRVEPRRDGQIHYGSVLDPFTFPVEALAGRGRIGGAEVRCESAEWAVRWRTGYAPRPNDLHDVPLVCARFGIPHPAGF